MDPLAAVCDLRRAAAELVESEDEGCRRVGGRLAEYLESAHLGADLEATLGLAGANNEPWWRAEQRERRDAALRDLAARHYGDRRVAQQAYKISRESARYAASAWRHDRSRADMPAHYADTAKALLWAAFASGAQMPLKKDRLEQILRKCTRPSVPITRNTSDTEGSTDEKARHEPARTAEKTP